MREDKRFTIKIMGEVFESDADGMLNLNDIRRGLGLPAKNEPSQWRGKVRDRLFETGNLQAMNINSLHNKNLKSRFIAGDEKGAIAYAMWVSVDFYLQVLDAFIELRRGNLEEAVILAAGTMSEEDEYLLVKFAAMKGLCFTKSCWYANIKHPNKLLTYLKSNPKWKYFAENEHGRLYTTKEGIDKGYTYNCYGNWYTNKVVMRFTQKGRELLRKNNNFFNKKVEENFHKLH